jgi:hypothetical protein
MARNIRRCDHCNNLTPHELVVEHKVSRLFDEVEGRDVIETFQYYLFKCMTCLDISLLGGFEPELPFAPTQAPVLYPHTSELHHSVPERIRGVYSEAARIRRQAPNAFAGQIRRALEAVCRDQHAQGRGLVAQLAFLANKGTIPPTLAEMTDLIRRLGNVGVHDKETEVDVWDAELIDEFFKSVVEYVYVAPSKVKRLSLKVESPHRAVTDAPGQPPVSLP